MSLIMSVSGIRGVVGETMTPQVAADVGFAFADYLTGGRVVVGRDSRESGETLQAALVAGLVAGGCEVIDLGVVSTPGVGIMVGQRRAAGGVVITASHNPGEWNGIKFITGDGRAPGRDDVEAIFEIYRRRTSQPVPTTSRGADRAIEQSTHECHVAKVLAVVDRNSIAAGRFKVVLDSNHGAGGPGGRQLLDALGCEVVHLHAEATGRFAHPPEPLGEHLTELCVQTRECSACVGFAQDPDADRLAIADETGAYIGEEYTLALVARAVFARRPGPAATNLSTSRMIDDAAARAGGLCVVHRTPTGEANVVEAMKAHECVIGGEGNGGVIDPRVVYIRDSLVAMAWTLQLLADEGRPLSQIVADMPAYAMVKTKFPCASDRAAIILVAVRHEFSDERINDTDGLRIDWPEGWVQIRRSNTEPIIRIIAEAQTEAAAIELVARIRNVVDRA
ncbi:MAG: phosphoglucosamine mutase [Planctomycetes bacterium]|nr:phosphoglucosamine mutase [Planctomycetota bacterium]